MQKSQWEQTFGCDKIYVTNNHKQNPEDNQLQGISSDRTNFQRSHLQLPRLSHVSKSPPSSFNNSKYQFQYNQMSQEEHQRVLKDLHVTQQRELEKLIRHQQEQQESLFQSWVNNGSLYSQRQVLLPQNQAIQTVLSTTNQQFKPYTLKQYQMLKAQPNNTGGLGAAKDLQWKKSKDRVSKMQEFSEQVKNQNAKVKSGRTTQLVQEKESKRQKGWDFARGVPKPKQKRIQLEDLNLVEDLNDLKIIDESNESQEDLRIFEQRNEFYKQQLEQFKF